VSKGSSPRPYSVSQQEFANNFDAIFRKPDPKMIEDQKNEDEAFEQIAKETEVKDSNQGG
jgi:ABC-type tungstate transport system permease subunit